MRSKPQGVDAVLDLDNIDADLSIYGLSLVLGPKHQEVMKFQRDKIQDSRGPRRDKHPDLKVANMKLLCVNCSAQAEFRLVDKRIWSGEFGFKSFEILMSSPAASEVDPRILTVLHTNGVCH